jgi:uncharacterized protein YpmS
MKMTVPTMRPHTNFKWWKRNFFTFLSLKAAYPVLHLAIWESGVRMDEASQNSTFALLMYA